LPIGPPGKRVESWFPTSGLGQLDPRNVNPQEVILMSSKATVTVLRPRQEVEQLWRDSRYRPDYIDQDEASVRFVDAPGDRGTEIHVVLHKSAPAGKLGQAVQKLLGTEPLAKVKDDLRRFKQHVETGVIPVSGAVPEGERLERKLKWRPAQPVERPEMQKAGV
jgi:hypothetical protein